MSENFVCVSQQALFNPEKWLSKPLLFKSDGTGQNLSLAGKAQRGSNSKVLEWSNEMSSADCLQKAVFK
jgi:hypothetical protein